MAGPNTAGDNKNNTLDDKKSPDEIHAISEGVTLIPPEITKTPSANEADLTQNTPSSEPQLNIEPAQRAIMAGLSANQIGAAATPTSTLQDPRNTQNGPDAQSLKNQGESDESVYGTGIGASRQQYNDAMSGADAGKSGGLGFATSGRSQEETQREKDRYTAFLSILDSIQTIGDLQEALNTLANEVDETKEAFSQTEIEILESQKLLSQRMDELSNLRDQQMVDVEAATTDAERNTAQAKLDTTENLITIYSTQSNSLGTKMNDTNIAIQGAETKIRDISAQIAAGATESDLANLKEQLATANESLVSAQSSLEDLARQSKFTANMIEYSQDGNIQQSELNQLINSASGNESLKTLAASLAVQLTRGGMTVTDDNGNVMGGEEASNFIVTQLAMREIDIKLFDLAKELENDPNNPELLARHATLNEEREALQNHSDNNDEYGMSYGNQAQDLVNAELATRPETSALEQAESSLATAMQNTINYENYAVYQSDDGAYYLQMGGEQYPVNDEFNAAEIMTSINAQIADGKTAGTPEIQALEIAAAQAYDDLQNLRYQLEGSASTNSSASSNTTTTTEQSEWLATETNTLEVPTISPDDMDKSYNTAMMDIELAVASGGALSQDDYDRLSQMPGFSTDTVDDLMAQNNVTLAENGISPNTPQVFGGMGTYQVVNDLTNNAFTFDGQKAQEAYVSFADGPSFHKHDDPNAPSDTYAALNIINAPNNNAATNFQNALTAVPPAPTADSLSAEELAARLKLEQELALSPSVQNSGSGQMG